MRTNESGTRLRGMARREFLVAVSLVAAGGGLARRGARAAAAAASSAQKAGTITHWWWGQQNAPGMKDWMEETNQLYEQQHPSVKIDAVLQETKALGPGFAAAAQAKRGPDIIFRFPSVGVLEDVWKGNLAALSDYWTEQDLSQLLLAASDAGFDGKIWGATIYVTGYCMIYNKKLFQRASLDPERPPETWDDFIRACRKLKAAGITPVSLGTKDGWVGGWIVSHWAIQYLSSLRDLLSAVVGDQKFTDPMHATWWERLEELAKNKLLNDDATSLTYQQGGREMFERQATAMTFGLQVYSLRSEGQMGPDTVGVMLPPKVATGKFGGRYPTQGSQSCITSFSADPGRAADYLRFTHTTDRLSALYKWAKHYPGDRKFDPQVFAGSSPVAARFASWIRNNACPIYENFIPTLLDEGPIFEGVQLIASGQQTAKGAAKRMEEVAEKWRQQNPDLLGHYKRWAATITV